MNHADIEALLGAAFPCVALRRVNGKRGWWFTSGAAAGRPRAGVTVDHGWASLQMRTDRARAALDALSSQSAWRGGVKNCEAADRAILRADVPLTVATSAGRAWVVHQLRESFDGMLIAAGHVACPRAPPDQRPAHDPELLAYACAAAGWHAAVKPDGTVRIDLTVRGALRSVCLRDDGVGIRAWVCLAAGALARANAPCRAAGSLLLMRASTALHWARAFASRENGQLDSAGFECSIAAPPDERALLLAVDALLAACELFGREAEALLEHQELAARYLLHASPAGRDTHGDAMFTGAAARAAAPSHPAHAAVA